MFDALISLLAPHVCVMCSKEGALLCEGCFADAIDPVPSRCYRCAAVTQASAVCAACRRVSPLKHVWVVSQYDGPPKEIVHRLKFGRTKQAVKLIALYLDHHVPALPPQTIVTFVPTATSRVRQRGYDHAELIARSFAKLRDLRCEPLLVRHGQARQVGADRKHRIDQAAHNYSPKNVLRIKNAEILLIDDIITTGATLESATGVLKKSGAKTLSAAVFAQK